MEDDGNSEQACRFWQLSKIKFKHVRDGIWVTVAEIHQFCTVFKALT